MNRFLLLLGLLLLATATKLTLALQSYEKQCFYEILKTEQKYSFDVLPRSQGKYELEVSHMERGSWKSVHYRQAKTHMQAVNIHKLAPTDSTYAFCLRNIDESKIRLRVEIQSGLELMEFELLPDETDSENLERELGWLESQKQKLLESLERMEGLRATSEGLSNLMGTKMIGFAVVGLLGIAVVNLLFYREIRKTFRDRKLI